MQLYDIVAGVLNIDPAELSEASNALNTANWDSLRHIELMLAVETGYNTQFTMAEMVSMQNLGDMRKLLIAKGAMLDGEEDMRLSA